MRRFALTLAFLTALMGCRQDARSQGPPPQRVPATAAQDEIGRGRETAITRAVRVAEPAVVSINVTGVQRVADPYWEFFGAQRYRQQQVQASGSGFVISPDGYVVTNEHVAANATRITVSFPDGETREARLVGADAPTDLALLKVDAPSPLPYLQFTRDARPIVGEWVIAIGNPFGLFEASEPSVTVGVVSATDRDLQSEREGRLYRGMIQTDAAINQGNSGGPLLNALGEVIGVNTAIYAPMGGAVGIGFAVPAGRARQIVEELRTRGSVDRSYYTGLNVIDVNPRIAQALEMAEARGAFVRSVDAGSPAARAGITAYDVITAIAGQRVANANDYVARVFDYRPGDRVPVDVLREGRTQRIQLTIGRAQ